MFRSPDTRDYIFAHTGGRQVQQVSQSFLANVNKILFLIYASPTKNICIHLKKKKKSQEDNTRMYLWYSGLHWLLPETPLPTKE